MQQEGVPRSSSEQGAVVNFQPSVGGGAGGDLEVAPNSRHDQNRTPVASLTPKLLHPSVGRRLAQHHLLWVLQTPFRSGRLLRHSTACKMGALDEVMVLNDRLGLLSEEAAHEWKAAKATDPENA